MAVWDAGSRLAVAEPVFAPRGPAEDDGYILSNIYDEDRDASFLAVFAARDLAAGPVARIHLDHRVPVGFHGLWRALDG
jgi:carotenoid cleavage dioxygenase-like enzyme